MRKTLRARPGTIGCSALFAEVPGTWRKNDTSYDLNDFYELVSPNGMSVFMLEDIIVHSIADEDEYTLADIPVLEQKLDSLFKSNQVSIADVKMFTVEQGARNVDFSVSVAEAVELHKARVFENHMEQFDFQAQKFLNQFSRENIGFIAHAFERVLANWEGGLPPVEELQEKAWVQEQRRVRPHVWN